MDNKCSIICWYRVLFVALVLLVVDAEGVFAQRQEISETKYDYSYIAKQITRGCLTKSEQAEAIYRWVCKNIAYDAGHTIHTADECWEERKGVCQAYCELFYRLGEPVGLRCFIIPGVSKNSDGKISDRGHAWLYIEVDDGCILADPTWGAGGMKDGEYVHAEDPMMWYDVEPHWMIFTHYPDNMGCQFLPEFVSKETFAALPPLKPSLGAYGFSGEEVLRQCVETGGFTMPRMYSAHSDELYVADIPSQSVLRPGHWYTFTVGKRTERSMALIHGDDYIGEQEWVVVDSCYTLRYMPTSAGRLCIAMQRDEGDYSIAIEYEVAEPTAEELDTIAHTFPYKMPEMKIVKNLFPEKLQALGIGGEEVLEEVRAGRLTEIFTLYKDAEKRIEEVDIPLSRYMYVGTRYRLAVKPVEKGYWAIFLNGKLCDMFRYDRKTGWYVVEVMPEAKGGLSVNVRASGNKYYRVLEYTVR